MHIDLTNLPPAQLSLLIALRDEFQSTARSLGKRPVIEDAATMFLWDGYDGPDRVS
jgi:hypothetical protein